MFKKLSQSDLLNQRINCALSLLTLFSVEDCIKSYSKDELYVKCGYKGIKVTTRMSKLELATALHDYYQDSYDKLMKLKDEESTED